MITEEDFQAVANCPPDLAFVRLERKFREMLESNLEHSNNGNTYSHYIEYMHHTLAAAGRSVWISFGPSRSPIPITFPI